MVFGAAVNGDAAGKERRDNALAPAASFVGPTFAYGDCMLSQKQVQAWKSPRAG